METIKSYEQDKIIREVYNCEYKTKEGKVLKGNINQELFGLKENEVLFVEEIF